MFGITQTHPWNFWDKVYQKGVDKCQTKLEFPSGDWGKYSQLNTHLTPSKFLAQTKEITIGKKLFFLNIDNQGKWNPKF